MTAITPSIQKPKTPPAVEFSLAKPESCLQNWSLNALIAKVGRTMMEFCHQNRRELHQQMSHLRNQSKSTNEELCHDMKRSAGTTLGWQLAGAVVGAGSGCISAFGPSVLGKLNPDLIAPNRNPNLPNAVALCNSAGAIGSSIEKGLSSVGQMQQSFGSAAHQKSQHKITALQSRLDETSRSVSETWQIMRSLIEAQKEQMRALAEASRAASAR